MIYHRCYDQCFGLQIRRSGWIWVFEEQFLNPVSIDGLWRSCGGVGESSRHAPVVVYRVGTIVIVRKIAAAARGCGDCARCHGGFRHVDLYNVLKGLKRLNERNFTFRPLNPRVARTHELWLVAVNAPRRGTVTAD